MIQLNSQNFFPLLQKVLPEDPVILEAGAFTGKDTLAMARYWPKATIYAFEPVPEIFYSLQEATHTVPSIKCYPFALSTTNQKEIFYKAEHPKKPGKLCQAGSLLKPLERLTVSPIRYPATIEVPSVTLNSWAHDNAINQIDFMWLDLQGHELAVLEHADTLLPSVKALYLEVNFIQAYSQQTEYHALQNWLKKNEFTIIAKDFEDETRWFFGNILCIKNNFHNK